jgi:hypothetical protein
MKPTYRGGSAYAWSTLTAMNLCMSKVHLWRRILPYDWSTFTRKSFPWIKANLKRRFIAQHGVHLWLRPTQFRRRTMITTMATLTFQSTIAKDNRSPLTISILFDCNCINCNGGYTWLLLPTDRITSGLSVSPRLWQRVRKERQPRLSVFLIGETTLWFQTTTSRGTT